MCTLSQIYDLTKLSFRVNSGAARIVFSGAKLQLRIKPVAHGKRTGGGGRHARPENSELKARKHDFMPTKGRK